MKRMRPPVIKAKGVTPSERYLAQLAEKSFLNLWSYPSPYRNQKQGGHGDGKEICDLLVVCDRYIIIFSEKTVTWPRGDLNVAWARWAKRAIREAARQARGAERWITEHPDRIFLDRKCEKPFPIDFPSTSERVIHRVVVANGAAQSCKEHIPESSGSLIIRSDVKGDEHWSGNLGQVRPFYIGDVDPTSSFVHVLNEYSLNIIMNELDTVGDFVDYLDKKAALVRSTRLIQAEGEENLLAYYAIRINKDGEHDFVPEDPPLQIDNSNYDRYINDPRYTAKKEADQISYLWDSLIKSFTDHMLDGTSITLGRYKFQLNKNERGVRYMVLEPRFYRRSHAEAIKGALERGATEEIFFRMMIKRAGTRGSETAFFILTFRYKGISVDTQEYEQYRLDRTNLTHIYARGILERYSYLERVIGIALEPPGQSHGSSEDMVYAEQTSWTDEERREIKEDYEKLGIFRTDMTSRRWSGQEFPDPEAVTIQPVVDRRSVLAMNRKQRRVEAAKQRRNRKFRGLYT